MLLLLPVDPYPARTSRNALAPKLMRRANGDDGAVTGESPSSIALSSSVVVVVPVPMLEMLSRRDLAEGAKGEVWVGEQPERPSVEMDMRRW